MEAQKVQNPAPQPVVESIQPVQPSRSKKTLFIVIAFVLISLIIAFLAGGYFLGKSKPAEKLTAETPTIQQKVTDTSINWKTYTSNQSSYSFKYPQTWKLEITTTTDGKNRDIVTILSDVKFSGGAYGSPPYSVYSNSIENPNKKTFRNVIFDLYKPSDEVKANFTYTQEKINGLTVYRTKSLPSQLGEDEVFFQRPDGGYIMVGFSPYDTEKPFVDQEGQYAIYNQILSTFKFTK